MEKQIEKVLLLKAERTKADDSFKFTLRRESDRPEGSMGSGEGSIKMGDFMGSDEC